MGVKYKKSNSALLLFFIIFLAFYTQPVKAQILNKIIKQSTKKAEDAVVKKTAQKAEKETNKAMDSILNPDNNKKQKDNDLPTNDETVSSNEEKTTPDTDDSIQKLKPWSKYNFIPGDDIIFQDDLASEESGEFPSRWDIINGNAENASLGNDLIINMDSKSTIYPLMESDNYLPEVFTIEFDAYFNEVIKANYYQFYKLHLGGGSGSYQENGNVFDPIKIFRHEIRFRSIVNNQVKNLGGDNESLDDKEPTWRHVAIAFNKRSLKIFIDQYRVLNIPNLGFKPKMFSIGGESSQSNEDFVAIKNIRIAEGGKKLYDRLMADGKFVTTGILFDVNKATIKQESMGVINEVVKMMKEHPELNFSIEGHTDSDGSEENNQKLSEKRAASVKEVLSSQGINASRLETKGFGESVPFSDNNSAEGKANNRRVEFIKV